MFVHGYSWVETNDRPSACILTTFRFSPECADKGDHVFAKRMPGAASNERCRTCPRQVILLWGYPENRAIRGNATAAILKGAGETVAAIVR